MNRLTEVNATLAALHRKLQKLEYQEQIASLMEEKEGLLKQESIDLTGDDDRTEIKQELRAQDDGSQTHYRPARQSCGRFGASDVFDQNQRSHRFVGDAQWPLVEPIQHEQDVAPYIQPEAANTFDAAHGLDDFVGDNRQVQGIHPGYEVPRDFGTWPRHGGLPGPQAAFAGLFAADQQEPAREERAPRSGYLHMQSLPLSGAAPVGPSSPPESTLGRGLLVAAQGNNASLSPPQRHPNINQMSAQEQTHAHQHGQPNQGQVPNTPHDEYRDAFRPAADGIPQATPVVVESAEQKASGNTPGNQQGKGSIKYDKIAKYPTVVEASNGAGYFELRCNWCGGNVSKITNRFFAGISGFRCHINVCHPEQLDTNRQISAEQIVEKCTFKTLTLKEIANMSMRAKGAYKIDKVAGAAAAADSVVRNKHYWKTRAGMAEKGKAREEAIMAEAATKIANLKSRSKPGKKKQKTIKSTQAKIEPKNDGDTAGSDYDADDDPPHKGKRRHTTATS